MSKFNCYSVFTFAMLALAMFVSSGCDQKQAADTLKDAEQSAKETAEKVGDEVGAAVDKGGEMVSELGEQAMAFIAPLKEKLGSLDSLKDAPEKLKTAVSEMITMIESKAEGITLPESMSKAIETIKTKLVELKTYLEGAYKQSGIDEKVKSISESVESGLGLKSE